MSFRIADILKDKTRTTKDDRTTGQYCCAKNEQDAFNDSVLHEYSQAETSYCKINVDHINCRVGCLPCMASRKLEFSTHHHAIGGFISYQPIEVCCSQAVTQTNNDRIYTAPYLYPEKIYSQTTYSHALPLSFPIYNHYSKRRNQVRFSTSQTKALEHKFSWQKYLSPEDRKLLAYSLKLSDRQVKTWFQNRRAKWRRNLNSSSNIDVKPDSSNTVT